MKCFSCATDKDLTVEMVYPYPEDECLCESPIPQLLTIECQGEEDRPDGGWDFRMAIMCHDCWHRLVTTIGIDMWIGEKCWGFLNPVIPFTNLPEVKHFLPIDTKEIDHEKWNPANYEM